MTMTEVARRRGGTRSLQDGEDTVEYEDAGTYKLSYEELSICMVGPHGSESLSIAVTTADPGFTSRFNQALAYTGGTQHEIRLGFGKPPVS